MPLPVTIVALSEAIEAQLHRSVHMKTHKCRLAAAARRSGHNSRERETLKKIHHLNGGCLKRINLLGGRVQANLILEMVCLVGSIRAEEL